jgi:hypothetical protein
MCQPLPLLLAAIPRQPDRFLDFARDPVQGHGGLVDTADLLLTVGLVDATAVEVPIEHDAGLQLTVRPGATEIAAGAGPAPPA